MYRVTEAIHFGGGYKTQEIIYVNRSDEGRQIVFQMEDVGAFGYNRRIIEKKNYLFLDYANEIDTSQINRKSWKEVNYDVNETGLNYP